MNLKNLSNVEILYNSNLKNKILVEIPHTPFHALFTYVKEADAWNIHILELMTTKRKTVAKGVSAKVASYLLCRIIALRDKKAFKKTAKIKDFAKELSKLLSNKKNHGLQ